MEKTLRQEPSDSIKVVVFGPESSGKTTLAKALATYFNAIYVPEYSRIYAEDKLVKGELLSKEDVIPIAQGQIDLENSMTPESSHMVICDTDLLETSVYAEMYYPDYQYPSLKKAVESNTYDLYFLTYIDSPWEADLIRDNPHKRKAQFELFENALIFHKRPYVLLKGSKKKRIKTAIEYVEKLMQDRSWPLQNKTYYK